VTAVRLAVLFFEELLLRQLPDEEEVPLDDERLEELGEQVEAFACAANADWRPRAEKIAETIGWLDPFDCVDEDSCPALVRRAAREYEARLVGIRGALRAREVVSAAEHRSVHGDCPAPVMPRIRNRSRVWRIKNAPAPAALALRFARHGAEQPQPGLVSRG